MGFEQLNLPEIFYVRAQTQNTENCSKTSNKSGKKTFGPR